MSEIPSLVINGIPFTSATDGAGDPVALVAVLEFRNCLAERADGAASRPS